MAESNDKRKWVGVLIIAIGILFLMDNLLGDLFFIPFHIPFFFFSWPMILIVIGVFILLVKERKEGGLVLLIIGTVFLLPDIFNISIRSLFQYWPLLLILAGVSIILRRRHNDHGYSKDDVDYIDELNILGGQKTQVTSQNFRGGKITSILGGSELDLSKAKLGQEIVLLDTFSMFGGTKIIVPESWTLKFEVFSLFGGFSDERRRTSLGTVPDQKQVLIIKGTTIFGGGEIKSF
ncbi:MAG: DUF5668 domain-containing protein [Bacteroidetes bacterium]|nr:DUF5668 domain-containing protein [Bacteroidota bacterium]MDA1120754.1 DUF5668 domain-containing protein [Bacteroidota bacterium]